MMGHYSQFRFEVNVNTEQHPSKKKGKKLHAFKSELFAIQIFFF